VARCKIGKDATEKPFSDGIKKELVKRSNRCVEVEGVYVKK
jgi:hypothetical protein